MTPFAFPFFREDHLRRGRTVLRPVARFSIARVEPVVSALIDTGSEHVLADSSLALIAGIDLSSPVDVEQLGGGGFVEAKFVEVVGTLHPPEGAGVEPVSWTLDIGFIDQWRPLYPVLLGNAGSSTVSRSRSVASLRRAWSSHWTYSTNASASSSAQAL